MLHKNVVAVVSEPMVLSDNLSKILSQVFHRLAVLGVHLRTSGSLGLELLAVQQYKELIDYGKISPERVEMYLPWAGYNTMLQEHKGVNTVVNLSNFDNASSIIKLVHPTYMSCRPTTKKLHAKNALIIFGKKLSNPVDFLITVASPDPVSKTVLGSTSSALDLAKVKGIPVFNFSPEENVMDVLKDLRIFLRGLGLPVITEEEVMVA